MIYIIFANSFFFANRSSKQPHTGAQMFVFPRTSLGRALLHSDGIGHLVIHIMGADTKRVCSRCHQSAYHHPRVLTTTPTLRAELIRQHPVEFKTLNNVSGPKSQITGEVCKDAGKGF